MVGLLEYLLIRLITVFDPAFCRVFFLPIFGLWLQANEVFSGVADSMAAMIANEYWLTSITRHSGKNYRQAALENQLQTL
ncbi:hypothetical protein BIV08_22650 [Pseudomonas sp. AF76]|uniref:hypothetical protein n=1 Tax=Pseudomonas sp. AF76 TaxID=554393 RepID=UPI000F47C24B|nr:hypothetical protein [Pseudomonas sp. AF76]ROO37091.1 hypothetical protein BIV08_22650 [Pseudomonas sp. AF76]